VRVRWTAPALADVEAHHDYLAAFNPAAARRVAVALPPQATRWHAFCTAAAPDGNPRTLGYSPCVIVYVIDAGEVCILHVWYAAQGR
jgi:plasmid stabilization system protein ParE